jgi:pimeloyl-ACP methyl ester carboxylesterase
MSRLRLAPNRALAIIAGFSIAIAAAGVTRAADADCSNQAVAVLAAFDRNDYAAARANFDTRMQTALPAEKLREVWTTLPQQLGTLDRRGHALVRHDGDTTIGVVPLHFAMGWYELQLVCAADGTVGGLWIKPALQPPTEAAADPFPLPDYAQPSRYGERSLSIGVGGNALPATLTLPHTTPEAAVVLVHGSGAHDADETIGPNKPFRDIAFGLASRNIAVLRYVKRAAAHPEAFAPDKSFTVDDETVDDALLAGALLRKQPELRSTRIFVIGHSLGAMMAPRIAQRDPAIAGVVLLSAPALPLEDTVVRQVRFLQDKTKGDSHESLERLIAQRDEIKHLDPAHLPTTPLMLNLPAAYWLDLRNYDPVALSRTLSIPMLVLQGGRDYQVTPADDFARWQSAFAHTARIRLQEYPTLSHLFMPAGAVPGPQDYQTAAHVDEGVIADIAGWISSTARGP